MQRVIGIDYGTSTTYMNVKRYNGDQPDGDKFSYMPVMFNYGESSGFVSSIARENADGTFDFGEKAAEPLEGARIHTEFKMRLESPDVNERTEARRVTGEFFRFLHDTYAQQENSLGSSDDTVETVLSYPVKWQAETVQFMLEAARAAGFRNVTGMDEATAAVSTAVCRGLDSGNGSLLRTEGPGYLLLIDMGAGTTDLVVCKYQMQPGGIRIELVTSWPRSSDEPTFGGREIDAALERYVEDYLTGALNSEFAGKAHSIASLPGQAKRWKELNVSTNLAANKPVTTCGYLASYRTMGMLNGAFTAFGRSEFEALIRDGLRDYARLIDGCLKRAAQTNPDFAQAGPDVVILTGGHSAWYFAREIIDGTMAGYLDHRLLAAVRQDKSHVVSLPNPQSTVSLGLVYSKLPFKLAEATSEKPDQEDLKTPLEKTFCMPIEDCFEVSGQGFVVTGTVSVGRIAVGDKVLIADSGAVVRKTAVLGIALGKEQVGMAHVGDAVGILLDTGEHGIKPGQLLVTQAYLDHMPRDDKKQAKQNASNQSKRIQNEEMKQENAVKKVDQIQRPDGMCNLTIKRKVQLTGRLMIDVDQSELYEIGTGSSIVIPVKKGRHAFSLYYFKNPRHRAPMEFDVTRDMDLLFEATTSGFKTTFTLKEGPRIVGTSTLKKFKE